MTKTDTINTRIEPELKAEAESVFRAIGVRQSDAISMFYRQVVTHGGLPFDAKIPNAETVAAMQEDVSQRKACTNVDELFADFNK